MFHYGPRKHNSQGANTKVEKISNIEVHGIATIDIGVGEELFCDYVEFGEPPKWLADFSKTYNIPMPFKGYNDFL